LLSSSYGQIPSGYYNAAVGLSGNNLRTALRNITTNGHVKLVYTPGVWNAYAYTDVRPAPLNTKIWDMYSDIPGGTPLYYYTLYTNQCGTASNEGDCYSREHCVPNSWWGGLDDAAHPQYSDLHHLFPADQYVNLYKSNNPIGQVGSYTYISSNGSKVGPCSFPGYTGVVFEPINEYKGDFARAYFYIATRYMDSIGAWVKIHPTYDSRYIIDTTTNNFKQWFIDMLIAWHNADTVSTKEINRNNAIYYNTGQHNRNPFVDHPEYVQAIWGGSVVIKPEPSNHISNFQAVNTNPLNSTITLSWTDATGAVLPDGYLIRASTTGFNQIPSPQDSIPEIPGNLLKLVEQGMHTVTFTTLLPGTLYYFKIFPYTNLGSNINYKTNATVPTASDTTSNLLWKEDFETGSKTIYANDTVNCSMGNWIFFDALIGTSASDRKSGSKSARLRYANLRMFFDKTGGVDSITIYHAKYGNDANAIWKLQLSIDEGNTWNYVGNPVISTDTILTPAVFSIKQPGNVRFNIETTSNTNRINIDDISITNYMDPVLSPPLLAADTINNSVDSTIQITFTDNAAWRANIISLKIGNISLIPSTDYVINAGNILLKPSGGNNLLTEAGSKAITIDAFGYSTDTIIQEIKAGVPTSNSTVSIDSALNLNSTRIINCTARDQYNNSVEGYTFKYDAFITNNDSLHVENYLIDGDTLSANVNNMNLLTTSNTNGISNFSVTIPEIVDPGDGLSIQLQLSDGSSNIGTPFRFSQLFSQTISFGALSAVTYGDANFSLSATASSGLSITYSSSNTAVANISANIVNITGIGTTTITASQIGNASYFPATDNSRTLTVNPKPLTITSAFASDKVYNGNNAAIISGVLTGIVGSDVVNFTGTGFFTDVNAGTAIPVNAALTLTGADAGKYTLVQPSGLTANITKAPQTISFAALPNKNTGDPDFSPGASSPTSGINAISYSSSNAAVAVIIANQIHIVGGGSTIITASQPGNNNYSAAIDVQQTLTVNLPLATIAAWDFTGVGSASLPSYAATLFNSSLVSSSGANTITRGSTAAWSTANNSFRTQGFKNEGISTANTDYFQITISAIPGYKVSLSTIDARFQGTASFVASPGVMSQFAYSLDGVNFTLIGSAVQSTSLTLTQINLANIAALQNIASGTTITLRYYASGQTTTGGWGFNSPSSGTYGLAIGGSVNPLTPTLYVNTISDFGSQCINTTTSPASFKITGTNLTASNVTVAALNGFSYATSSGGPYTSTLSIPQSGGNFSQDVYIKFSPTAVITYDGSIVIGGGGAAAVNRTVTASGIQTLGGNVNATSSSVLGGQPVILTLAANAGSITKWQKSNNGDSLWTDLLFTANPFSELPNALGSWYYRAVVKNGGCPEAVSSQANVVVSPNTTIFTAAISNDWNITGNWSNGIPDSLYNASIPANKFAVVNNLNMSCNNLSISALAQLSIYPSKSLTVKGVLTLASDSSGSASLIDNGTLISASNILERFIANPDQFHLLSSPVVNQPIDSILSSTDSLYLWSETTANWISYREPAFLATNNGNSFIAGKGYAASFSSIINKRFTGEFNKDTISIPLTLSTGSFSGWNLVANPYPSAINWNSGTGFSRTILEDAGSGEKAIWIWNPAIANYGCYISNTSGTNGINQHIAVGQGFWVKASNPGIFSINNSAREHSMQPFLKVSATTENSIRIKVSGAVNPYSDETMISFGKTNDQYGAEKMFSTETTAPDLYTQKYNKKWSINFLTNLNDHPFVPLFFRAGVNGFYTLTFSENPLLYNIVLQDKKLGIQQNMNANLSYEFTAQTTDNENRFLLYFSMLSNNSIVNKNNDICIYAANNAIFIQTFEEIKEIIVYNMLGQEILRQSGNNKTMRNFYIQTTAAYYIVKVLTEKNVFTKKVLIE
jgi:endonuclease I